MTDMKCFLVRHYRKGYSQHGDYVFGCSFPPFTLYV